MKREEFLSKVFESYRLIKVLADKNGCKVLRLRHKTLEKDIILRSFPQVVSAYDFLCDLKHENLPMVLDTVTLDDGQIVFEEFIDGITVAEVLETGKYRYLGAKRVITSVCQALKVFHGHGFVHRDIKPENIIIGQSGRTVLIDFNISRKMNKNNQDTVVMGTVGYASPEQLGITQSDPRTDIYALGVLLNIMLIGKHPCEQIAKGKAGRIIKKCTGINPNQRFQSVDDLVDAL